MLKTVFKGISQIMLQDNIITGIIFVIGIAYGRIDLAIGVVLASLIGLITAYLLKFDKEETEHGLYGFSASLVGVATLLFLKPHVITWCILILGSFLATVLQNFFIRKNIPAYTFPFVLITWLIIFFVNIIDPSLLANGEPLTSIYYNKYLFSVKGYGQVIFQDSIISGILFFIAVMISSPISAIYGLFGGLISGLIAYYFVPFLEFENGLWSYNAVLCAIVFAKKDIENIFWAGISIMIALIVHFIMARYNIIALTFPFVIASFITVTIKNKSVIKNSLFKKI